MRSRSVISNPSTNEGYDAETFRGTRAHGPGTRAGSNQSCARRRPAARGIEGCTALPGYPYLAPLSPEGIAEDSIVVAQQVARELVKGKGFSQLLSRPVGRRMGGHIEVQNAPPVIGQYQEHVKNLETDGGDSKESRS